MKVLFLTDVHASEDALRWIKRKGKDYQALLIGGDLAKGGAQDFIGRFLSAALSTGRPVYFVQGNADKPSASVPEAVISLHGKTAKLGNYTVGGLGGSSATPFGTPFELTDEAARGLLDSLGHVDIPLSHCPPYKTKCDWAGGRHVGSVPVREYVEREEPDLVLSGHAHESPAIDKIGATTLVNAGPLMDGRFAEVGLDRVISVELKAESIGG